MSGRILTHTYLCVSPLSCKILCSECVQVYLHPEWIILLIFLPRNWRHNSNKYAPSLNENFSVVGRVFLELTLHFLPLKIFDDALLHQFSNYLLGMLSKIEYQYFWLHLPQVDILIIKINVVIYIFSRCLLSAHKIQQRANLTIREGGRNNQHVSIVYLIYRYSWEMKHTCNI